MQKYYPQYLYDDTAMQGWICAEQFVAGLKAIGRNVTQNRLVDVINRETALQRRWARATYQLDSPATPRRSPVLRGLRRGRERQDLGCLRPGEQRVRLPGRQQRPPNPQPAEHAGRLIRALKRSSGGDLRQLRVTGDPDRL